MFKESIISFKGILHTSKDVVSELLFGLVHCTIDAGYGRIPPPPVLLRDIMYHQNRDIYM